MSKTVAVLERRKVLPVESIVFSGQENEGPMSRPLSLPGTGEIRKSARSRENPAGIAVVLLSFVASVALFRWTIDRYLRTLREVPEAGGQ